MIQIKNVSNEEIEIVTRVDTDVRGCRILDGPPAPVRLKPGSSTYRLGYEPGVSLIIRPVKNPEVPRGTF